jgi:hypothetical protein
MPITRPLCVCAIAITACGCAGVPDAQPGRPDAHVAAPADAQRALSPDPAPDAARPATTLQTLPPATTPRALPSELSVSLAAETPDAEPGRVVLTVTLKNVGQRAVRAPWKCACSSATDPYAGGEYAFELRVTKGTETRTLIADDQAARIACRQCQAVDAALAPGATRTFAYRLDLSRLFAPTAGAYILAVVYDPKRPYDDDRYDLVSDPIEVTIAPPAR